MFFSHQSGSDNFSRARACVCVDGCMALLHNLWIYCRLLSGQKTQSSPKRHAWNLCTRHGKFRNFGTKSSIYPKRNSLKISWLEQRTELRLMAKNENPIHKYRVVRLHKREAEKTDVKITLEF